MTIKRLKQPYPYFGGKSKVAERIWARLGNVPNYIEPFFGSGAILLDRPHEPGIETVNDLNAWLTNFWRATKRDPEKVAYYADYPVSELDLHARGDWLFYRKGAAEFVEKCRSDPEFYCAKSAGWWVWGICCWIGSGWGNKVDRNSVTRQRPDLADEGRGVMRQEVWRQLPHLSGKGQGVSREAEESVLSYILELAQRTKKIRVCSGDWRRVCSESVTIRNGITGVVFDPPYGNEDRHICYQENSSTVSADVRTFCKENTDNPLLRMVLCGYAGEGHEELEPLGWEVESWKAGGGYANQKIEGDNNNGERERIWYSPHCIKPETLLFQ
jgi:DNA adenine methylase